MKNLEAFAIQEPTLYCDEIVTGEAAQFLVKLHKQFNAKRLELLKKREERQAELDRGVRPDFLKETESIRKDPDWQVAKTPDDLQKRWVEITGPTDRKMIINALNSGADVFMADFEDANSPTWANMIEGQKNLIDAIDGNISFSTPEGKEYRLKEKTAVLLVRPRGWHLEEKHFLVENEPISASLFDFGLYFFHNAKKLLAKGSGPYFYLPKLENHREARLWNDVFLFAQQELGLPKGTIRATVLLETILAAFEMEEILYELREHSAGLNAGRWDYIFSAIKKFHNRPNFVFPDRSQIVMTVPFMRAYTELLVKTCHKRGAHVIGGMAAFIPSRKDEEVNRNALAKVEEDKIRESNDGFDGTWVAHPDLVPLSRSIFEKKLQGKPHQKERKREEVNVSADQLINFEIPGGKITDAGLRKNINVALQYLHAWLSGIGAAAIFNLMEDAATAEICRAQIWQWLQKRARLEDGTPITIELYKKYIDEEFAKVKKMYGNGLSSNRLEKAAELLNDLVLSEEFPEFLTLFAYEYLINYNKQV